MQSQIETTWSMVEGTHKMRDELLDRLTDADLAFNPGGANLPFGAVCREMGEVERAYVDSFKNLKQNFDYRHADTQVERSLDALKAWLHALDAEMQAALDAFTADTITSQIERGGWSVDIKSQLEIYLQALLIFFGKASVYVRALNKPLPDSFTEWIG